ncbi:MAG: hypothetical protein FWF76_02115 [Oscillospiraceae bacterium]|nr:hypothetical protein [Oscillospiraceae bacterium]
MAQTETRHAEKSSLFKLMMTEYTGDVQTQIAHQRSIMEPEDVEIVEKEFNAWKEKLESKKS